MTSEQEYEATALLILINQEFRTDAMSVQCFDLRIVERLRVLVEALTTPQEPR